jgi:hypothetical protein
VFHPRRAVGQALGDDDVPFGRQGIEEPGFLPGDVSRQEQRGERSRDEPWHTRMLVPEEPDVYLPGTNGRTRVTSGRSDRAPSCVIGDPCGASVIRPS